MKNKGFNLVQSKSKNGWSQEKTTDRIFEQIPEDEIDYDKLEKEALTTEQRLELETKKILKHNQQKNLGYIMDSKYYFSVFFICEEDKNEFFEKLGVSSMADIFINGYDLAKALGIKIERKLIHLPKPKSEKI